MAIVSVEPLFEGRGASQDWERKVTSPRLFEVVVDDVNDGEPEVTQAVDPNDSTKRIPGFGDLHPNISNCIVVGFDADNSDDTPYIWIVKVLYDSHPSTPAAQQVDPEGKSQPGETPGNAPENPLAKAAQWRIGSIDRTEPVRRWLPVKQSGEYDFLAPDNWLPNKAYDRGKYVSNGANVYWCDVAGVSAGAGGPAGVGFNILDGTCIWEFVGTLIQVTSDPRFAIYVACLNSGKVPFDPPGVTDVSIPTVVITMAIPNISIPYAMSIKNAVNLTRWKNCPPRTAKVMKFEAGNKTEGKVSFIEATWEIGLDPDTWDFRPLDAGYGGLQMRTVPNKAPPPVTVIERRFVAFKDANGDPVSNPVPMNGAGGQLDPESDPVFLRGVPVQQKLIDFNQEIPF